VRHVRMLGLCLVAAFAVAAVAASSAMAGPQWVKCEFAGPGHNYTGSNCTKAEKAKPKGTGEYELYKAPEVEAKRLAEGKPAYVPFTGGSVGSGGVLFSQWWFCSTNSHRTTRSACEAEGGHYYFELPATVECTKETNKGRAEGKNKISKVEVLFTGCVALETIPCESENLKEGEIETKELTGKLGWINKAEKTVGVELSPEGGKHSEFTQFNCVGVLEIGVGAGNKKEGAFYTSSGCSGECPGTTPEEEKHGGYDSIISPITPVNEMTSTFTQVFTINSETDENIPNKLENKHISLLESFTEDLENGASTVWSPSGEEITNVNTPEEEGEIKA
jgi:hypothetical protein